MSMPSATLEVTVAEQSSENVCLSDWGRPYAKNIRRRLALLTYSFL